MDLGQVGMGTREIRQKERVLRETTGTGGHWEKSEVVETHRIYKSDPIVETPSNGGNRARTGHSLIRQVS